MLLLSWIVRYVACYAYCQCVLRLQDMTTQTQDLSQALVVSDSQFAPSFIEDSQPMSEMGPNSEVFESDSLYVPVVLVEPTPAIAAAAAIKLAAAKAKKDGRSNNMKWQPFMSMFVLN